MPSELSTLDVELPSPVFMGENHVEGRPSVRQDLEMSGGLQSKYSRDPVLPGRSRSIA